MTKLDEDTCQIIVRLIASRDALRRLNIEERALIREAREAMAEAANALETYARTMATISEAPPSADVEYARRLHTLAASGTAENFLQCDDETKRGVFALAVEESSHRKELERLLAIRTGQVESAHELWCKAAERALSANPGASNSTNPAHSLWLRVELHRSDAAEVVMSNA